MTRAMLKKKAKTPEAFILNDKDNEDGDEDRARDVQSSDENEEDGEDGEDIGVVNDAGFWEPEAVAILQPFKEEWCEGDRSDEVITRAIAALKDNNIPERDDMKKCVKLWLQRRALTKSKLGPGHAPSMRTLVQFYKAKEIAKAIQERFEEDPMLDRKQFIGIHANEVGKVMRTLMLPCNVEELKELEIRRQMWIRKGPPMAIRRQ